jgi:hypothetical protein
MQNRTTDIQEMIKELNRFQLPSSRTESFDTWREEAAATVSRSPDSADESSGGPSH